MKDLRLKIIGGILLILALVVTIVNVPPYIMNAEESNEIEQVEPHGNTEPDG